MRTRMIAFVAVSAFVAHLGAQTKPTLGAVRAIHISGQAEMIGSDRQVADCLAEKLKAQGPFTFPTDAESSDAALTLTSHIPSGGMRVVMGRSPSVKAELKAKDGTVLWSGENKYKKSTTAWGGNTDIPCGLANGLANKIVKAIQKTK